MIQSYKVASTLAAQRIVYVSAANTVAYLNTITSQPIGVTKDSVLDTINGIAVAGAGEIAEVIFNDTVAAGGKVTADANGKGIPFVRTADTICSYIGELIGPKADATGTIAQILINPGQMG